MPLHASTASAPPAPPCDARAFAAPASSDTKGEHRSRVRVRVRVRLVLRLTILVSGVCLQCDKAKGRQPEGRGARLGRSEREIHHTIRQATPIEQPSRMVEKEIIIIHMHGVRRNGGHVSRMSTSKRSRPVTTRLTTTAPRAKKRTRTWRGDVIT